MNRIELKEIFDKNHISPKEYSLNGPTGKEDIFILEERYDTWFVYYTEKGEKIGEQIFNSEDEACKYLLNKMLKQK